MYACSILLTTPSAASDQDFYPGFFEEGLYTEGWDQVFYFPDGTLLVGQFAVTNVGIGDHNAGVLGVIFTPDGRHFVIRQSRRTGDWSFAKDLFDFTVARHRLHGVAPDYRMEIRKEIGEIELGFTAEGPLWQLGDTVKNDKGFQYVSFYAPIAVGHARYRMQEKEDGPLGKWQELGAGRGYAARYINSTATGDLFRSSVRIVSLEQTGPRPVLYIVDPLKAARQVHAAIFDQGRLINSTQGPLVGARESAETLVGGLDKVINIDTGNANFRLTGKIRINNLLGRLDPVDLLKPYVRIFVRLFNTPLHYRYLAHYDLSYVRSGQRPQRLVGRALVEHMLHSDSELPK